MTQALEGDVEIIPPKPVNAVEVETKSTEKQGLFSKIFNGSPEQQARRADSKRWKKELQEKAKLARREAFEPSYLEAVKKKAAEDAEKKASGKSGLLSAISSAAKSMGDTKTGMDMLGQISDNANGFLMGGGISAGGYSMKDLNMEEQKKPRKKSKKKKSKKKR